MNLSEAEQLSEEEALEYLEKIRWPNGPICPHCGSRKSTKLNGTAHRAGVIQCNGCRDQYTVTVGSVMESTHIDLNKWIMAFHLFYLNKKGISAMQLKRELGLGSYQTAWFMVHRIRHAVPNPENVLKVALNTPPPKKMLKPKTENIDFSSSIRQFKPNMSF